MDPNQPTNTPEVPTSPQPVPTLGNSRRHRLPLILAGLVLLGIIGGGSYYLASRNNSSPELSNTQSTTPSPTSISQSPSPTEIASPLPAGWTWQISNECEIYVPLPPKEEPYYIPKKQNATPSVGDEGGWWHFESRKLEEPYSFFDRYTTAIFKNPDALGSGYVAGVISISCGPNTQNFTTQSFVDAYEEQFTQDTQGEITFRQDGIVTRWGHDVIQATFTGGMYNEDDKYYFLATPTKLYNISMTSMSQSQFINETTEQIFNNLRLGN